MDEKKHNTHKWLRITIRFGLPVLIIVVGFGLGHYLYATKPKARRARPGRKAPLVEVMNAEIGVHQIAVTSMGTVVPAREITLKPRLNGQVMEISQAFEPGGFFQTGEMIMKLDPADIKLVIRNQTSRVNQAQANLMLEMGHQDVAREELKLLKTTSGKVLNNTDLALRKPQLVKAEADLEAAKVALEQAQLDLKRTVIRAPFNSIITARFVERGAEVTQQNSLATLVGTDVYWVEAAVPVDRLRWIMIPGGNIKEGSRVKIQAKNGSTRQGNIIRLLGELNSQTRMAGILIRVDDPLALSAHKNEGRLLLGSYVSVWIEGKTVADVFPVPVSALRTGNTIWLMTDGKLAVRSIRTVWKGIHTAYVSEGLHPDEKIVLSDLSSPVEGMALRTDSTSNDGKQKPKSNPKSNRKIKPEN